MADHAKTEYATADGNDYVEHERTYRMFVSLVKWNVLALSLVLILMYIFLV